MSKQCYLLLFTKKLILPRVELSVLADPGPGAHPENEQIEGGVEKKYQILSPAGVKDAASVVHTQKSSAKQK